MQEFTPVREHLLLQKFFVDFPHHNDGMHLSGGVSDDATCKSCWRRLAV